MFSPNPAHVQLDHHLHIPAPLFDALTRIAALEFRTPAAQAAWMLCQRLAVECEEEGCPHYGVVPHTHTDAPKVHNVVTMSSTWAGMTPEGQRAILDSLRKLASVPEPLEDPAPMQNVRGVYKHDKSGRFYEVIGTGNTQNTIPLIDGAEVVIYRGVADGTIWARPTSEFLQRFSPTRKVEPRNKLSKHTESIEVTNLKADYHERMKRWQSFGDSNQSRALHAEVAVRNMMELLTEVTANLTRDDDLPNDLPARMDKAVEDARVVLEKPKQFRPEDEEAVHPSIKVRGFDATAKHECLDVGEYAEVYHAGTQRYYQASIIASLPGYVQPEFTGERPTLVERAPDFETMWERYATRHGIQYGEDALENVKVGHDMVFEHLRLLTQPTVRETWEARTPCKGPDCGTTTGDHSTPCLAAHEASAGGYDQKVHELKSHTATFEDVLSGVKHAEFRKDDRDFNEGDILLLREWDVRSRQYTGRVLKRTITHRQVGYGIPDDCVVLSIIADKDKPATIDHEKLLREILEVAHTGIIRTPRVGMEMEAVRLIERLQSIAKHVTGEEFKQMLGEALSQKLGEMGAMDWADSRNIDEVLEAILPVVAPYLVLE